MPDMADIKVHRYGEQTAGWLGWVEPEDLSWILFIDDAGKPVLFDRRDAETGAVV